MRKPGNGTRKSRTKKTPTKAKIAKLEKEAMSLWGQVVRKRAGGKCEWCGAPGQDAHHMVTRSKSRYLRHASSNGCFLCKSCHMKFHNKEADTGWRLFEKQRPADYAYVCEHKNTLIKVDEDWVKMEIQLLKDYLDEV